MKFSKEEFSRVSRGYRSRGANKEGEASHNLIPSIQAPVFVISFLLSGSSI